MKIILVHGFNVRDRGAGTTDKLRPFLEGRGLEVKEFDTGWRGLLTVRLVDPLFSIALSSFIDDGDLLIGHSDGCNLISQATWRARVPCKVAYLNPALNRDTPLAPNVEKALVFHTPSDRVVWISKWLPWHRWGQMGRVGYLVKDNSMVDPRYKNVSYESLGIRKAGHSGVFKTAGGVINTVNKIEEELL